MAETEKTEMMDWRDNFPKENRCYDKDEGIIYCADCLDILPLFPKDSVDLVLTDPPYGFGRFEGDEKDSFMTVIHNAFESLRTILKQGSWAFVFSGTGQIKNLLIAVALDFQRLLWLYKPNDCTFPYRGWLLTSEAIALFSNGNPLALQERKPYRHDVYVHTKVGQEGVEGHPTVKPLWVVKDLASRNEGLILDPFLGSGTTAVAAKELGRKFIGIEISREYCDIAIRRLGQGILL